MRWIYRSQRSWSESFSLVFIWLCFLFHIALNAFPISLCRFHEKSVSKQLHEQKGGTLRWIQRSERNFPENFFLVFIWGCFLWLYILQSYPKYQFSDSTKTGLANSCMKYSCNSVSWIHTSQSSFWESSFLLFVWVYFPYHRKLHCENKYPIAYLKKTELANWSMKRNV